MVLAAMSATALAYDPLGLYFGAAVGQSNVRSTRPLFDAPADFVKQYTGWKLVFGLHPLPLLGAEIEYLDFGHPQRQLATAVQADARARGAALYGLLYAPLPLPTTDLYAKAGVARLKVSLQATSGCAPFAACPGGQASIDESVNGLAFGAGAQLRYGSIALRAEYERIRASGGDPDLFSVGVFKRF